MTNELVQHMSMEESYTMGPLGVNDLIKYDMTFIIQSNQS